MKRYLLSVAFIGSFATVAAEAPAVDLATVEQQVKTLQEKVVAYLRKAFGSGSHLVELAAGLYFTKVLYENQGSNSINSISHDWQVRLMFAICAAAFLKNSTEGLNDKLELQLGQKFDTLTTLVKRKLGRQA